MWFRPVEGNADIAAILEWLREPKTARWLDAAPAGGSLLRGWVSVQKPGSVTFVFGPDGSDAPVGVVGVRDVHRTHRTGEVWLVIGDRRYHHRGYAVDALRRAIDHAFDELGLESLFAWTVETNTSAVRLAKRVGFQAVGRRRACHWMDGAFHDRLLLDLTKDERRPARAALTEEGVAS